MKHPRKIIIDTDPGHDDAVAILLALASPEEVQVLGITAVAGNVLLALTQKNARVICELAGWTEVPVFAGRDAPGAAQAGDGGTCMARPGLTASRCPIRRCRCRTSTPSIS